MNRIIQGIFAVSKIVGKKHEKGKELFKVRWKNYGPKHDTWEPRENLEMCEDLVEDYLSKHKQNKRGRPPKKLPGKENESLSSSPPASTKQPPSPSCNQQPTENEEGKPKKKYAKKATTEETSPEEPGRKPVKQEPVEDSVPQETPGRKPSRKEASPKTGEEQMETLPLLQTIKQEPIESPPTVSDEHSEEMPPCAKIKIEPGTRSPGIEEAAAQEELPDKPEEEEQPAQKDTFWLDLAKGCQPPALYTTDMYSKVKSRRSKTAASVPAAAPVPGAKPRGRRPKNISPEESALPLAGSSCSNDDEEEVPLSQLTKDSPPKVKKEPGVDDAATAEGEVESKGSSVVSDDPTTKEPDCEENAGKKPVVKAEKKVKPVAKESSAKEPVRVKEFAEVKEKEQISEGGSTFATLSVNKEADPPQDIPAPAEEKASENVPLKPEQNVSVEKRGLDRASNSEEGFNKKPRLASIKMDSALELKREDLPKPASPLTSEAASRPSRWSGSGLGQQPLKTHSALLPTPVKEDQDIEFDLPLFNPMEWQTLKANFRSQQVAIDISFEDLIMAVKSGYKSTVFKAVGIKPKARSHDLNIVFEGTTLLVIAVERGYDEIAEILVLGGADPNLALAQGKTPLMVAVEKNQVRCLAVLADLGAMLGCQDNDGNSALHMACYLNRNPCIELLLQLGANPGLNNKKGLCPINLSNSVNNHSLLLAENLEYTIKFCSPHFKISSPLFPLQIFTIREGPLFVLNFYYQIKFTPGQLCLLFLAPTDSNFQHRMRPALDGSSCPVVSIILNDFQQKCISLEGNFIFCLVNLITGTNQLILHTKNLPKSQDRLLVRAYKTNVQESLPPHLTQHIYAM